MKIEVYSVDNNKNKSAAEIFKEVSTAVAEYCQSNEIDYEYIALDMDFKNNKRIFPDGVIAVYAKTGNSEGYRVDVVVLTGNNVCESVMGIKTYSMKEAIAILNYMTELFY